MARTAVLRGSETDEGRSTESGLVSHDRADWCRLEQVAPVEKGELDEEHRFFDVGFQSLEQLHGRGCGAARRQEIVD